jgi:hypothetical protein
VRADTTAGTLPAGASPRQAGPAAGHELSSRAHELSSKGVELLPKAGQQTATDARAGASAQTVVRKVARAVPARVSSSEPSRPASAMPAAPQSQVGQTAEAMGAEERITRLPYEERSRSDGVREGARLPQSRRA